MTLHVLSFPSAALGVEESMGILLIGLLVVLILWLTVCCTWFIHCDHRRRRRRLGDESDGKCELLSVQPYQKIDLLDFKLRADQSSLIVGNLSGHTRTGGLENLSLNVNPLENRRMSSLKITRID